jgi:hypothetical protein
LLLPARQITRPFPRLIDQADLAQLLQRGLFGELSPWGPSADHPWSTTSSAKTL